MLGYMKEYIPGDMQYYFFALRLHSYRKYLAEVSDKVTKKFSSLENREKKNFPACCI